MVERSPSRWDEPLDESTVDPGLHQKSPSKSQLNEDKVDDLNSSRLELRKRESEQGISRVVHNFGDLDYSKGANKIDLKKFIGPRSKVEATTDFINNIIQVHQNHLEKHEQMKDQIVEN